MYLTWLNNNSWLIEIASQRILLDPWLVGDLSFNLDWLVKGVLPYEQPIPERVDLILLSQGLADHAHPPTLERLDRTIPVVGSVNAAKVVQKLGYKQVNTLNCGESFKPVPTLEIQATKGSSLGPTIVENGYLIKDLEQNLTLYYEPHGDRDPALKTLGSVDIAIVPIIDVTLPLAGAIIKGKTTALELAQSFHPQVILPTAAGGDVSFEGLLQPWFRYQGSVEELRSQLERHQLSTQVIAPLPGERIELNLKR